MKIFVQAIIAMLVLTAAASAQERCEDDTPYSVGWPGFSTELKSDFTVNALGRAGKYIGEARAEAGLTDDAPINADAKIIFIRKSVGGFHHDAVTSVARHYFCLLRSEYPEKSVKLNAAYSNFSIYIEEIYSSEYYDKDRTRTEKRQDRSHLRELRKKYSNFESVLTPEQVVSALPNDNFNRQTIFDVSAKAKVANLIDVSTCVGTAFASLQTVDEVVLAALQGYQQKLAEFLQGGVMGQVGLSHFAVLPKRVFALDYEEEISLSGDQLFCIEEQSKANGSLMLSE